MIKSFLFSSYKSTYCKNVFFQGGEAVFLLFFTWAAIIFVSNR